MRCKVILLTVATAGLGLSAFANIPGGGTGTGANVTLTGTSTTATMSNGIVSIVMTKSNAQITTINYTFNNTGSSQTLNLLSGNPNGGKLYWEHSNNQGLDFTGSYTVVVDPATNGGNYAEISLTTATQANMPFEVRYAMHRGSPGFYVTAIWSHNSSNGAFSMGECRNNIYAGSIFNWMSVDATRNKLMQVSGGTSIGVPTAPVECSLWTNGIYQGQYEDKYKYSAHWGDQRVWGWSSVGAAGKNVGLWNVLATSEYYNGGPLHAELMCHIGTTILNMFNGNHYEMGTDGSFVAGETWAKVCGPYFVYCNNISKTIADQAQASQALYQDALAQGVAEAGAWPYSWFSDTKYAGPASRGTVTGKMVINDPFNPNATASNLWVGLIRQPATSTSNYDFQQWMKPYQFWVHTDANGNFSIPAVIAGSNYTLYAFGPGAGGTFMSQAQTGGNPPILYNLPAAPFSVTVTGGATTALGSVVWTPTRVGPSVFEIGYPDRTARQFRHGEDWWVGDIGPSPTSPSPVWSKWMAFPFDFPSGPNYVVGSSRWTTDWNFAQPVIYSSTGTWNSSSSTITFNLASAPAGGTQASLYLGIASDYYTALIVTVNGVNLGGSSGPISGVTATPSNLPSTGFVPTSSKSNSTLREGINGAFSDQRVTFPGTMLNAGTNTIKISQRQVGGTYFANHAMYDYLRLELTNYVPPAPSTVTAFAGNNRTLVTWPAVPGAISYKILRSTVSGSGHSAIATGVTGPVCGSGPTTATYVDTTAVNGTTYYYVVQSTNPVNSSANSAQSSGVTPSVGASTSAPAAPAGLSATAGNGTATLNWGASSGANLYTVKRATLTFNGGGSTIPLNNITLTNAVTGTSYTDTSVSNGTLYSYTVAATNSAGTGTDSTGFSTTPVPTAPTNPPASLTATALENSSAGSITLSWAAVAGAVGYVVQRATAAGGPYTFLYTVSSLTATNSLLAANTTYHYQVATMNNGGTSSFITASATTPPAAPANLVATAGAGKVTLTWTGSSGATSYIVGRATTSGGAYSTMAGAVAGTTYVDSTAVNGVTYYYVVAASGAGGTSDVSAESSATPVGVTILTWTGTPSGTWDTTTSNWLKGGSPAQYANGNAVIFDDTATNATVTTSGTLTPVSVLFHHAGAYTLTAPGLSGDAGLTKLGAGTLNITGASIYSGGTTIGGGSIAIIGGTGNAQNGMGTGTITMQGGTLTMNGHTGSNSSSYGVLANPIDVPGGATGMLQVSQRGGQSGPVTGAGTLAVQVNFVRGDLSGDWSGFTGQINVTRTRTGTNVDNFRINSNAGFGTAALNLGPYVQVSTVLNAVNSFTIGELSGDANAQLAGIIFNNVTPGNHTATYVVGGRNTNATFAGSIADGASPSLTAITKVGSGTWTLDGSCTYTGPTVVSGGVLKITGSASGSSSLSVASGATLHLAGGSLSIAGTIVNHGTFKLSGTPTLTSTGNFTNNGVLDLINGPQTLPANFVNHGAVVDSSVVKVQQASISESGFTATIQTWPGHTYQLQRTISFSPPITWTNVGMPMDGDGTLSSLTDPGGGAGVLAFYRVEVSP